jgi:hypothetical protein
MGKKDSKKKEKKQKEKIKEEPRGNVELRMKAGKCV